jgi:type VI secretion system protein ImpF
MAQADGNRPVKQSLLQRLIVEKNDPGNARDPLITRAESLRQLKASVELDLEALLNTRQEVLEELPSELKELGRSLVVYGLPDFTSWSLLNTTDRDRIHREVEQAIAIFEPRLQRVKVTAETATETRPQSERRLRFRIDAHLRVDPAPEPVSFDGWLLLNTQEYRFKGQP